MLKRNTTPINWVDEETAMKRLGYQKNSLRIFTRTEKCKKLPIRTTKPNSRTVLYSGYDIEQYLLSKAI